MVEGLGPFEDASLLGGDESVGVPEDCHVVEIDERYLYRRSQKLSSSQLY